MSTPVVDVWGPVAPGTRSSYPPAPEPHDEWNLAGGTAWVYYSPLNRRQLIRPVILSDGFSGGSSDLDQLWHGLEENSEYRFVSELHAAGRDVIILGYDDRTATITANAETAIDCIRRATAERVGRAKLAVGGFSMGGMVTRYALAKMEQDPALPDHETSLYFSYDSPHHGAWFPIALQAFTHFATDKWGDADGIGPVLRQFSGLLNSPAAKQMARWHIGKATETPKQAPERVEFLKELDELGGWPRQVRKVGVSNGVATGVGNGVRPDATAVRCDGETLHDTWLKTQAKGEQVVARLQKTGEEPISIRTSGLPDIDGAPGGLFTMPSPAGDPGSFGLAALLMGLLGNAVDPEVIRTSCFIPSISAVAAGEIDDPKALHRPIAPEHSALDAFVCAGRNEGHTAMTEELGAWIVNEIVAVG
ncbi:alpha/beta hydrolase [Streptomyces sp. NBC_00853]|uniref:esterase/lipase family protein n=1 Tax=Streptomyces sp. NBC_00853 TaxID=2903681 RepID=UPI0038739EA3|nr:alpha/beta hydrolase [Streptomyces sp. NBC_00853]